MVLKLTKNGKTPEQDIINWDLYKYAPQVFKLRLLQFLNNIYRENCIPNERRNAIVTPIFKKGDRREPQNYRGVSILNTCYKIHSKILNMKLQKYSEAFMTEIQNGFQKGRSCTDPTFCLKLLIEKIREFNLKTHLLFTDYEKAFDNIEKQILFNILKSRHVPDTLLTLNLLTTTIVAPPSNASKWQMGFNSAFKGLNGRRKMWKHCKTKIHTMSNGIPLYFKEILMHNKNM